ncbi:MAG: hypothetical protein CMH60_05515 [Myxococcales bacterium]|nr:hypothetical protein [Myxococcales bacterium]|tara:strand:- start:574 stop:963 length:390 start_codon:yes stop_codon:yes gene_type:complete
MLKAATQTCTLLLCVFFLSCNASPLNKACEADDDCGPGYDCYQKKCVQVCTSDAQCPEDKRCKKYRCLSDRATTRSAPKTAKVTTPAENSTDIVEKQALRREFELIRQNQIQMMQTLQEIQKELKELRK